MEEKWGRLIYHNEDLGDYYLVSTKGRIKNAQNGYMRKLIIGKTGYYYVGVSLGSRDRQMAIKVHRAVAETFLDRVVGKEQINHKDGNKLNNNIENLEWCTPSENSIHAVKNGLMVPYNEKRVKCVNNGREFKSIKQAAKWCGVTNNAVANVVHGRCKHGGKDPITNEPLTWVFV